MFLAGQTFYLIISILIIVGLLILFFVTYVLNKRTPPPKGCEKLVDETKCLECKNTMCKFYKENIIDEIKEELKK